MPKDLSLSYTKQRRVCSSRLDPARRDGINLLCPQVGHPNHVDGENEVDAQDNANTTKAQRSPGVVETFVGELETRVDYVTTVSSSQTPS